MNQRPRKMDVTIAMPEGTHRFQNGYSSIAISSSNKDLAEGGSHDLHALGHTQFSKLVQLHNCFTFQIGQCGAGTHKAPKIDFRLRNSPAIPMLVPQGHEPVLNIAW